MLRKNNSIVKYSLVKDISQKLGLSEKLIMKSLKT